MFCLVKLKGLGPGQLPKLSTLKTSNILKDEHFDFRFPNLWQQDTGMSFFRDFCTYPLELHLIFSQSQFPKLDFQNPFFLCEGNSHLLLCPWTFHPNGPPSRPALTLTWLQSLRRCDRWMPFFEAARPKSPAEVVALGEGWMGFFSGIKDLENNEKKLIICLSTLLGKPIWLAGTSPKKMIVVHSFSETCRW